VPVRVRSLMKVDPRRDDLAVKLVELRSAMKSKSPELAGGLKVAANSAAFGIFSQLDVGLWILALHCMFFPETRTI